MVSVPGTTIFTFRRRDRASLAGDHHRPIAVAHAGAAGADGVLVGQVGVGVQAEREGGEFEFALKGSAVEGFDID